MYLYWETSILASNFLYSELPSEPLVYGFKVLRITNGEICSVVDISSNKGTTDVMNLLEKEFGKRDTTRTWNTVLKLAAP